MKIIGYGICGPGEADRYLRQTLEEFKRLCDEVVILCNNTNKPEHDMIDEYGFKRVSERREWGKFQWKIKQDFIERDIKQLAEPGDMIVCLDMDETIPALTREWLLDAPFDAYHVFVVDLWNDPEHFKLESCFWNVRIWRWGGGDTKFKVKPVHCGLAPEWAYHYHRHAPFALLHKGLMAKEDRERKIKRYERYDPHAEHLKKEYYEMLKDDAARPFDFAAMQKQVEEEVASYKETKPKEFMNKTPKERFAYVKNPHGEVIDIPERHLQMTLKRDPRFEFIGWADEQEAEIDAMFADDGDDAPAPQLHEAPHAQGSYQRPAADEKTELDQRNAQDDQSIAEDAADEAAGVTAPTTADVAAATPAAEHPKPDPNKPKEEPKVEKNTSAPKKKTVAKGGKKK